MVAVVANDIVVPSDDNSQNALVDTEACGKTQGVILAHKGGQFFLQLYVQIEGAVEETAAGTAGAILVKGGLGLVDDTLVTREACVGIRTKHQHLVATHLHLSALLAGNLTEIGIDTLLHKLLRHAVGSVFLF